MGDIIDIPPNGGYSKYTGFGWADGAGITVPENGALGWAYGAIFRHIDGSGVTDAVYINTGDHLSASFRVLPLDAPTGILATSTEINRMCDLTGRVVQLSGSTNITEAAHADRILLMMGTGAPYTQQLPVPTGNGARYRFVVGAVNTSNHVIAAGGQTYSFCGNILTNSTADAADAAAKTWTAYGSSTITLNGTTSGGMRVGDYIECIDCLPTSDGFLVWGFTTTSGVEITPFS